MVRVKIEDAEKFSNQVLGHYGVPTDQAEIITEVIMDSELRGYDDHGLFFLKAMLSFGYEQKFMNPGPNVSVIKDDGSTALIDGDGGCGAVAAKFATGLCIEKAKKYGIAGVGVKNSGNIISPAVFALDAAKSGLFGCCSSNITALMAPTGGIQRALGTNPIAYAAPTSDPDVPFLFDMASSSTAAAKIMVAANEGKTVEADLIQSPEGYDTTDPLDFLNGGAVIPASGPKGYGISMMIDILCGVLTGAEYGSDLQLDNASVNKPGHFIFAIDITRFIPLESFTARIDDRNLKIKNGDRKHAVDEILIPGERGLKMMRNSINKGYMELNHNTWDAISDLSKTTGVSVPNHL